MAKIKNDIQEATAGILMPQLTNQFRVVWLLSNEEVKQTISLQVVNFNVNYKEKTIEFDIEQPIFGGALHECLWDALSNAPHRTETIRLTSVSGESTPRYVLNFITTCKSHKFNLDYSNTNSTAKHHLVFDIINVYAVDPKTLTKHVVDPKTLMKNSNSK